MLLNFFGLVVVLGILVVLHEGGHFLAARAVGAPVRVFSFGFGKRLFGFRHHGTDFRVSLIPLGGYVRIEGLGPDESDVVSGTSQSSPLLPRWRRAVILAAGPAANVVGAIVFLAALYVVGAPVPAWQLQPPVIGWVAPDSPGAAAGLVPGDQVLTVEGKAIATWRELELATYTAPNRPLHLTVRRDDTIVEVILTPRKVTSYELGDAGIAPPLPAEVPRVLPNSPAEKADLAPGDLILAVDDQPVGQFADLVRLIRERPGREVVLTVARAGEVMTLRAVPRDEGGRGVLGIPQPNPEVLQRLPLGSALVAAVRDCGEMTRETFRVIARMLTGRASVKQMSGPIDIARFSGNAVRSGTRHFIRLLGIISLQLAIFNLLPIPILDGGHLAVLGVEAVARRDLPARVKERMLNVGFWLILALIAVVLFNDVLKNL